MCFAGKYENPHEPFENATTDSGINILYGTLTKQRERRRGIPREPQNMKKLRKILYCALCATMMTLLLTGCGLFSRKGDDNYDVVVETDMYKLEEGGFYVHRGEEFHKLHLGYTTFEGQTTDQSDDRIAWFGKDWTKIPTMYKGDTIILHTAETFVESFNVERFEDLGYSLGICNMEKRKSGRFLFSTDPKLMNINPGSDASVLYELGEGSAVIERIGDAELRSGNVSRAGSIIGLNEGDTYNTEVYTGTYVNNYDLIADSRVLCSMDIDEIVDYDYMQATYIRIRFPEYFNSGYYMLGGYGIVRYIATDEAQAHEDIEMNLPNTLHLADVLEDETLTSTAMLDIVPQETRVEEFTIAVAQKVTVTINLNNESALNEIMPIAKIIGNKGVFTLSPEGDDVLTTTCDLEIGDYTLEISGLAGRTYTYRVEAAEKE